MQLSEMNNFQRFTNIASELNRAVLNFDNPHKRTVSIGIAIDILIELKNIDHSIEIFRFTELVAKQYIEPELVELTELKDYIYREGMNNYYLTK